VGNDICVIDLDDCFDSGGKLKPVAQNVVEAFSGCYMEHSPSGKGLHIFFKATGYDFDKAKYYVNNRKLGVEIYVSGATNRFVTVTGNMFADGDIAEKSYELQMILDKYMLRPTPVKQLVDIESQSYLSDKSVIEKAFKSVNGERFKALWQGDTSGYASASEADLALCGMLAFWCGRDIGQMDRLFRKSGLMRDKWNRPQSGSTYGMITIQKAIASVTEVYKPGGKRSSATEDFLQGEYSLANLKTENNERYPWTDIGASRLFADYYKSFARMFPKGRCGFAMKTAYGLPILVISK
jgi:putative DNA primase/helicase